MSDDLVKRLRGIDRTDIYLYETMNDAADRIEELKAKLAKAKIALAEIQRWVPKHIAGEIARTTLAALTGEK